MLGSTATDSYCRSVTVDLGERSEVSERIMTRKLLTWTKDKANQCLVGKPAPLHWMPDRRENGFLFIIA